MQKDCSQLSNIFQAFLESSNEAEKHSNANELPIFLHFSSICSTTPPQSPGSLFYILFQLPKRKFLSANAAHTQWTVPAAIHCHFMYSYDNNNNINYI